MSATYWDNGRLYETRKPSLKREIVAATLLLGALGGVTYMLVTQNNRKKRKPLERPGFTVGVNCTLVVQDLEKARAAAYAFGLAGPTHDEAVVKVFGGCGMQQKMQIKTFDDARNLFWLGYEVVRGSLAAGRIDPAVAQAQLTSGLANLAAFGVDTSNLPKTF